MYVCSLPDNDEWALELGGKVEAGEPSLIEKVCPHSPPAKEPPVEPHNSCE